MVRAAAGPLDPLDAELEPPLVLECALGSDAAWRHLHLRYCPVVIAFLRKLGVREVDVEDAAQEVFLQIYRYLPRFRGDAQLKTWLYRLCITQARRARRRRRISETVSKLLARAPEETLVSTPAFSETTARRRIENALAGLSDGERIVLVLYELEGIAGKQIAEILSCKEATVWRRLHYARKKFLHAIGATALEGSP